MLPARLRLPVAAAFALVTVACGSPDTVGTAYTLPGDRVYPEGIAADPRTGDTYVGSYATGAIYRATPDATEAEVFLPAGADGRATANGLKVDPAGRLWVTDSTAGVTVYDIATRRPLARFTVPGSAPRFVNDLAITPDGTAYLTDSVRGGVYRVTPDQLAAAGTSELTVQFDLSGRLAPRPADKLSLNGIVTDGRYLLVVDMVPGELYRIALDTGEIRKVALHGGDVTNGDGLELRDGTLWVVQNTTDTISRWTLGDDGASATKSGEITDAALHIPTTMARVGDRMLVVASQFDKGGPMGPGEPSRFEVVAVHGI
ncbi:superoxide dismutase [Nocardia sp. NPDC050697]|uniref:SMP-30/gluconolactonase/LRE family protein n=1 Tax=Nocardia sp. NPDC050697 TaxID=3155158 RepID=UPI0033D9BB68